MRLNRQQRVSSDEWISVIPRPQGVEVARVRRSPGALPKVLSWDVYAGTEELRNALKRLRGARRLTGGRCTTLLGNGQYHMFQMEAPSVPAEEQRDAMRWRIKEMLDFPVDQAGIDLLEIPTHQNNAGRPPQVYVVAANNAVLTPLIQAFQGARVPLAVIDIPELALRNVSALFEEENRGQALLSFDANGGRLTFTYQRDLYVSRHIDVKVAEMVEAAQGGSLYERVLLDVQRSMDNFDRNYSFITLSRLLVSPFLGSDRFISYLQENLFQPAQAMDLAQGLDISAVPALADPVHQSEALLAIGAALREEE